MCKISDMLLLAAKKQIRSSTLEKAIQNVTKNWMETDACSSATNTSKTIFLFRHRNGNSVAEPQHKVMQLVHAHCFSLAIIYPQLVFYTYSCVLVLM